MDIFTTQLARVVPVTIQPEKLKVKALVKEAALSKVKGEMKELDPNDYAFYHSDSQKQHSHQRHQQQLAQENTAEQTDEQPPASELDQAYDKKMLVHKTLPSELEPLDAGQKEKIKHLDIFV
jgi:paraquat-inducible protein B